MKELSNHCIKHLSNTELMKIINSDYTAQTKTYAVKVLQRRGCYN